jgi:hypothetical protein
MSDDITPTLQDLLPEVILSQKCHMNIGLILNSYRPTDIWNTRWSEPYVDHQGHLCVLNKTKHNYRYTSSVMRHPDISADTWRSTWMMDWLWRSTEFATVVTRPPSPRFPWKTWCMNIKYTDEFQSYKTHESWLSTIHSSITIENQTYIHMTFLRSWSTDIQ